MNAHRSSLVTPTDCAPVHHASLRHIRTSRSQATARPGTSSLAHKLAIAIASSLSLVPLSSDAATADVSFIGSTGSTLEHAVVLADGSAVRYSAVSRTISIFTSEGAEISTSIDQLTSTFPEHAAELIAGFSRLDAELVDPSFAMEWSSTPLAGGATPTTPIGYPIAFPSPSPWSPGVPPGDVQIQQHPAPLAPYSAAASTSSSNDPNSPFGPCSFAPCSTWRSPGFRGSVRVNFQFDAGGGNSQDPIDAYDRERWEVWRRAQCQQAAGYEAAEVGLSAVGFAAGCAGLAIAGGPVGLLACGVGGAFLVLQTAQWAETANNCAAPYPGRTNWGP